MSERQICAAIIIQAHCRGYLARKVYFEKLLVLFEEV